MKTYCNGKLCHATRAHADHEAARMNNRHLNKRGDSRTHLHAFKCDHCGSFHVGHAVKDKPQRRPRMMEVWA